MEADLVKITSHDATFQQFYDALAHSLGEHGTVFTPYPIISPNARMAVPLPTQVLVELRSADAFSRLYQAARDYVAASPEHRLELARNKTSISVSGEHMTDETALREQLWS
ncbi:MAG TPA: hypothetical protein VGD58_04615 [Herpetosiphonaceae bacterium]